MAGNKDIYKSGALPTQETQDGGLLAKNKGMSSASDAKIYARQLDKTTGDRDKIEVFAETADNKGETKSDLMKKMGTRLK